MDERVACLQVHTLTCEQYIKPVVVAKRDWDTKMLLDMIGEQHESLDQPMHALIDSGALITGMSNEKVAQYLLAPRVVNERGKGPV